MEDKNYQIKLKLKMSNEQRLIRDNFNNLTNNYKGSYNLQDDVAFLTASSNKEIVISSDMLSEGRHFFEGTNPDIIAYKALATNVSDIISKGVRPKYYSLNIALGRNQNNKWLEEFTYAINKYQRLFGITLIGGDTISSINGLTIAITIFGFKKSNNKYNKQKQKNKHNYTDKFKHRNITRLSANHNDIMVLLGEVGSANIGLKLIQKPNDERLKALSKDEKEYFIKCFNYPNVKLKNHKVIKKFANSAMDVSDGLLGDLSLMMMASKNSALINLDNIPINKRLHDIINEHPDIFIGMLTGGDDYILLCTIPQNNIDNAMKYCKNNDIIIKDIGRVSNPLDEVKSDPDKLNNLELNLISNTDYSSYLSSTNDLNYSHF